jgi:hypothetical protein
MRKREVFRKGKFKCVFRVRTRIHTVFIRLSFLQFSHVRLQALPEAPKVNNGANQGHSWRSRV